MRKKIKVVCLVIVIVSIILTCLLIQLKQNMDMLLKQQVSIENIINNEVECRVAEVKEGVKEELYFISEIGLDRNLQKYLYDTCKKYNVKYIEALAVMTVENSTYNPKAIHKNKNGTIDVGLFQINSCNHKRLKEILKINDFYNPQDNIEAGVYMLSKLIYPNQHYRFMAYNMGDGGMKKAVSRGVRSTKYSKKVINMIKELQKCEREGDKVANKYNNNYLHDNIHITFE